MNKLSYLLILFFCFFTANAQMNHMHHNMMGEMEMPAYQHPMQDSVAVCSYQTMMQHQNKTYYFCSMTHLNMFDQSAEKIKTFNVVASQFKFTPSTLIVNHGDIVQIVLTSTDVAHGFYIKNLKINVPIKKGEKKVIEFVANKTGKFPFICPVYCGSGHHNMKGELIVK